MRDDSALWWRTQRFSVVSEKQCRLDDRERLVPLRMAIGQLGVHSLTSCVAFYEGFTKVKGKGKAYDYDLCINIKYNTYGTWFNVNLRGTYCATTPY